MTLDKNKDIMEENIIELIAKDYPEKPIESKSHFYCPICKHGIHKHSDKVFFKHCPWCGQRLDWRIEEEKMRLK